MAKRIVLFLLLLQMLLLLSCSGLVRFSSNSEPPIKPTTMIEKPIAPQTAPHSNEGRLFQSGQASFYGGKFHGRKTANGEIFDSLALTAAHKTLPFNSVVRVENSLNGKSVIVRINDRGPFAKSRIIDLSVAAAKELDFIASGVADVDVYILE